MSRACGRTIAKEIPERIISYQSASYGKSSLNSTMHVSSFDVFGCCTMFALPRAETTCIVNWLVVNTPVTDIGHDGPACWSLLSGHLGYHTKSPKYVGALVNQRPGRV